MMIGSITKKKIFELITANPYKQNSVHGIHGVTLAINDIAWYNVNASYIVQINCTMYSF